MSHLKHVQDQAAKQAIITSARKIILHSGLDGLSMRGLAKQVGCSPATLYKHFENKEDLLDAIREEGWQLMAQIQAESDLSSLPIAEKLIAMSERFQRFPEQYPEHYLLMFGSLEAETFTLESHAADHGFQGLVKLIAEGMENGQLDGSHCSPEQLAYHIWFLSHGIAMLRITLFRDEPEFKTISDDVIKSFANSMVIDKEK